MRQKGISILVCCYNSSKRLPDTLRHIANQNVSDEFLWEVILVDNASTDDTSALAIQVWNELHSPTNLILLSETRPGKSYALELGYNTSQYEYIVICDDDNWLPPAYIKHAYELIDIHPDVGLIGGKATPYFEAEEPHWFTEFQVYFGCGSQKNFPIPYGAGSIIRYTHLYNLYGKGFTSLLSDKKGNNLGAGGDTELGFALLFSGSKIINTDDLTFNHFMTKNRLTEKYLRRLRWQIGISSSCLIPYYYTMNYGVKVYTMSWGGILAREFYSFIRKRLFNKSVFHLSFTKRIEILAEFGFLYGILINKDKITKGIKLIMESDWVPQKYKL